MEREITDDQKAPKGEPNTPDYEDTGKVTEDHRALKNQSSTTPEKYPKGEREAQSLVQKDKKRK